MDKKHISFTNFVFLDRDGIINEERGDFTTTVDEWRWVSDALQGITMLTDAHLGIIVITNQSCIAKGLQTKEGLEKLHTFMTEEIRKAGGDILGIYYCPHNDEDNCFCRKPQPGLILQAARDHHIDLARTFFIGDSPRDMEAGKRAGTKTILVHNHKNEIYVDSNNKFTDYNVETFIEAVNIVINETKKM